MNRGGPVIDTPKVELIFWGSGWNANAANMALRTNLVNAVQSIVSGPYLSALTQYATADQPISGTAVLDQTFTIATSDPPAVFNDGNITKMLIQNMGNKTLPNPSSDPNLFYYVYPQPGSTVMAPAGTVTNGAHGSDSFGGVRFHYGYGADPAMPIFDQLTSTFSHELVEGTTDPEPGTRPAIQVVAPERRGQRAQR